jgi:beta-galactosidase GanA
MMVEHSIPFEMINDQLLDEEHLHGFKLLILPNIAALSDEQCRHLKKFVEKGGSLVATYETSLYNERKSLEFRERNGWVECVVPSIEDFEMLLCVYR